MRNRTTELACRVRHGTSSVTCTVEQHGAQAQTRSADSSLSLCCLGGRARGASPGHRSFMHRPAGSGFVVHNDAGAEARRVVAVGSSALLALRHAGGIACAGPSRALMSP